MSSCLARIASEATDLDVSKFLLGFVHARLAMLLEDNKILYLEVANFSLLASVQSVQQGYTRQCLCGNQTTLYVFLN